MLELLKAEFSYRKWHYIGYGLFPLILTSAFFLVIQEKSSLLMDFRSALLFGFGTALFLLSLTLPKFIHRVALEENRYLLLGQFPISQRALALTQSLVLIIVLSATALSGYFLVFVFGMSFNNISQILIFNYILLALAVSLSSLFFYELLTQLPKYSTLVIWLLVLIFFAVVAWLGYLGIEFDFLPDDFLLKGSTFFLLAITSALSFFGHMLLFTHLRKDFSKGRRF